MINICTIIDKIQEYGSQIGTKNYRRKTEHVYHRKTKNRTRLPTQVSVLSGKVSEKKFVNTFNIHEMKTVERQRKNIIQ